MLHISQGQLNVLSVCPRKFQYIYLEQLGFPATPDHQERLTWGNRFHLLMQQRELGLPIEHMASVDAQLQQSVEALVASAPQLFQLGSVPPDSVHWRESEHRRMVNFQGYLLTVVYDLLILDEQHAQILDWKTYPRPQDSRWLAQHWQTRLYPFVLAETSDYAPEQISMTYWFVQAQHGKNLQPQQLSFRYTSTLHHHTHHDLTNLLSHLTEWLEQYEAGGMFPQVEPSQGACDACTFATRCHRGQNQDSLAEAIPDLAAIEEVAL